MEGINMIYKLTDDCLGEEEKEAAIRVIRSGKITMGENVAELEQRVASYVGRRYAVMTNSGSSANLIAASALMMRQEHPHLEVGDLVVAPAVGWSTTYSPFQQLGLRLGIVDVDRDTFNIDPYKVERFVASGAKMIVAVNILGNPCDFDLLQKLGNRCGVQIFEDNCESFGAHLDGKRTGSFGLVSTMSTFFSHQIHTGEGGFVLTDEEDIYHLLLCLRAHGWARDLPEDQKMADSEYDLKSKEDYVFLVPGYNVRPLEVSAAIGLIQLDKLESSLVQRRANRLLFDRLFGRMEDTWWRVQEVSQGCSHFSFPLVFPNMLPQQRAILKKMMREADIECRMITGGSFFNQPSSFWYETSNQTIRPDLETPVADRIHRCGFFFGNTGSKSLEPELRRLRRVVDEFVSQVLEAN